MGRERVWEREEGGGEGKERGDRGRGGYEGIGIHREVEGKGGDRIGTGRAVPLFLGVGFR